MDFRKCFVCGEDAIIWDLEKYAGGFRHRNNECPSTVETLKMRKRKPTHDESAADAVEASTGPFARPEDGSEQRYKDRRKYRPWLAHSFWWIVHNGLSHPLIAVLPFKPLFMFHDWTSKKMHGR